MSIPSLIRSAQSAGFIRVYPRQSVANVLKFVCIALTLALLVAIVVCSLTSSPNMREMWWIPDWLGTWADRNGNFRNFPVFAAFAALLFLVFNTCHAVAAPRVGGFAFLLLLKSQTQVSALFFSDCAPSRRVRQRTGRRARSAPTPPPQPPRRSHGSSLDDTRGFCWCFQCWLCLYAVVISQKCCPAEHC